MINCQMSKVQGSETAIMVANESIQILGCYGYSREYLAEKFLRDARHLQFVKMGMNLCEIE